LSKTKKNNASNLLQKQAKSNKSNKQIKETHSFFDISPLIDPAKTTIIPLLKKFIFLLKRRTSFFKFNSLNEIGFSLINDKTYFPVLNDQKEAKRKVFCLITYFI